MGTLATAKFLQILSAKEPGVLCALCRQVELPIIQELDKLQWSGVSVCEGRVTNLGHITQVIARPAHQNGFARINPGLWVPTVTLSAVLAQIGASGEAIVIGPPDLDVQVPWGSWEARAVLIAHHGAWEELSNRMLLRGYNTQALDDEYICFTRANGGRTW